MHEHQKNIVLAVDALIEIQIKMATEKFRFSMIHNPIDKYFLIISATDPDRIKNKFPQFNIYLNASKQKMVEFYIYY